MNVELLSDRELATCVDEFVQRAINHARKAGYSKNITVNISATSFSPESEYKIEHKAAVGDWNEQRISTTNNLVSSTDHAVARWLEDQLDAPTVVRQLIAHQPEPEVDEAFGNEEIVGEAKAETEDAQFDNAVDDDDGYAPL